LSFSSAETRWTPILGVSQNPNEFPEHEHGRESAVNTFKRNSKEERDLRSPTNGSNSQNSEFVYTCPHAPHSLHIHIGQSTIGQGFHPAGATTDGEGWRVLVEGEERTNTRGRIHPTREQIERCSPKINHNTSPAPLISVPLISIFADIAGR
jgi:hypothetical protein